MTHFEEDIVNGMPGLPYYLQNPGVRAAMERSAYGAEIGYANSLGDTGAASELQQLMEQEIRNVMGTP